MHSEGTSNTVTIDYEIDFLFLGQVHLDAEIIILKIIIIMYSLYSAALHMHICALTNLTLVLWIHVHSNAISTP